MNLYEATIRMTYESGKVKEKKYQVPAESENMAYLKFGRIFSREEYEVEVLNFKKVSMI